MKLTTLLIFEKVNQKSSTTEGSMLLNFVQEFSSSGDNYYFLLQIGEARNSLFFSVVIISEALIPYILDEIALKLL